jgi:hypothetical protein
MQPLGLTLFLIVATTMLPPRFALAGDDPWAGEWARVRTPSALVWFEEADGVGPRQLEALEASIQRLARRLSIDSATLSTLAESPIQYLYTRDNDLLRYLGAEDIDGMAEPWSRKIITSRIPHEHELVHVLVYMAVGNANRSNEPWLQEGLASYLGGHLDEAPLAVLATGDGVLDSRPELPRELLSGVGFRHSLLPASERYAASARFVEFLDRARGGIRPLLELLDGLAGPEDEVSRRPTIAVQTWVEGVYRTPFDRLLSDFHQWRADHPVAGIVPAVPPGRSADVLVHDDGTVLRVWIDDEDWILDARSLRGGLDCFLGWGGGENRILPGWTAPGPATGYALQQSGASGSLVDRASSRVLLRWRLPEFAPEDEWIWRIPSSALVGIPPPDAAGVMFWSRPRFEVD